MKCEIDLTALTAQQKLFHSEAATHKPIGANDLSNTKKFK